MIVSIMKYCPHCSSKKIQKSNFYTIKHSRSKIRRYLCTNCKRSFSSRTRSSTYNQKKPFLNSVIAKLLVSGNTQNRIAFLLKCSKNTVAKKLKWLSQNPVHNRFNDVDLEHIQIDELESIEHTKLKPVTIPICVSSTYKIIGLSVGKIRAKGHLAELSFKKYGPRENEREQALVQLFERIKTAMHTSPKTITTDAHPLYPKLIKRYFPETEHIQIVSRDTIKKKRELVYTAERKKVFDPLFALNQRCAMLRSDIRRLTRRSWCTTKKIENLFQHLCHYQNYNNTVLT